MLPIIVKLILGIIMSTSAFIIARKILNYEGKISILKVIGAILLITSPTFVLYDVKYNIIFTLMVYTIMALMFKYLFKIDIAQSILVCGYIMLLTALVDVTLTIVEIPIFSYYQVRNVWYIIIANNTLISAISILISYQKKAINIFKRISDKVEQNKKIKSTLFTIIVVVIVCLLYYNITTIFKFNLQYTITFFSIILFFILYYIYMEERNNYDKLKDEYNTMFSYVQTFEDWIDNEQMYRHELKNNLSIIRNLTNKKEIDKKIDKMLKMNMVIDDNYIETLKEIPKGGLKGLLYYKLALALKANINIYIDVSPKIKGKISKLDKDLLESLCIVLGIYIDNALDACKKEKHKNVTIEIYEKEKELYFVISNSCSKVLSIKKMNEKGFTTKGSGHGRGLYFANKVIRKEKRIAVEQQFLNNYFIQKIIVK